MHQANCLNCESNLQGDEKFCPACSQKTATHRFTWGHFFHEAWHAFTHTDKGLLNLLKGLATQPGNTVSEYVSGKHKKYFNPITFTILCLAFFVLINSTFKPFGEPPKPDPNVIAQLKTEQQRKMYLGFYERAEIGFKFQQQHPNILAMFGLPLEAFILWLFFRRRGRNYLEVLIAVLFLGGFANLIFTIAFSPLLSLTKDTPYYIWATIAGFSIMSGYFAWGMKGFLGNIKPIAFWKPFLVTWLYYFIWTVIGTVFFLWFVLREQSMDAIRKLFKDLTN